MSPGTGTGKGRPAAPSETDGSDSDVRRRTTVRGFWEKVRKVLGGWRGEPSCIILNPTGEAVPRSIRRDPSTCRNHCCCPANEAEAATAAGREAARPHAMPALHFTPDPEMSSRPVLACYAELAVKKTNFS